MPTQTRIESETGLREIYRRPKQRSLDKEVDHLDNHCRDFIAHSPFVVLATASGDGRVDVSPKGGTPGFVVVLDDHRLAIPDMSGNNRLDSMRNIVSGGATALLFMVPGTDETMRVNGRATISVDRDVLERCPVDGMKANVAIVVEVETAFIHCAKPLRRSGLWHPERWPDTSDMATPACMLNDHIGLGDAELSARVLAESYARTTWAMGGEGSASDEPQSAEAGAKRRPEPTEDMGGEGSASDEPQSAEAGAKRRPEPTEDMGGEGSASDEPTQASRTR